VKAYFILSISLALAALGSVFMLCTQDVGPDSLTEVQEHGRELDRVIAASQARYAVVSSVVDELADGTLSLSSAVSETSDEYNDQELTMRITREKFGGDSKEEVICRHLLFRVAVLLKRSPRYHDVLERLEREFAELYPHAKQPLLHRLEGHDSAL
jgi:hypothetical protein